MTNTPPKPSRRGFFVGAAATGAATAALVSLRTPPQPLASDALPQPAPEKGGGYSLSEHVKTYYKTARV
jgi:anaerobic selenocysteine-containing dehydrogenase